jgi:hypothetical protein
MKGATSGGLNVACILNVVPVSLWLCTASPQVLHSVHETLATFVNEVKECLHRATAAVWLHGLSQAKVSAGPSICSDLHVQPFQPTSYTNI